jgi:WD40 repeat protein
MGKVQMLGCFVARSGEGYKTPSNYSSACFGPQGRLVAAGSLDGGVYLWNTQTGKLDRVLKDHGYAHTPRPPPSRSLGSTDEHHICGPPLCKSFSLSSVDQSS